MPTDAAVIHVTTKKAGGWMRAAGINGGVLLWISGKSKIYFQKKINQLFNCCAIVDLKITKSNLNDCKTQFN